MSLVTLSPPISFGNEHNDPVRLVVAFGSADNNAHLGALSELARLLGDGVAVASMMQACSSDEVLELLRTRNGRPSVPLEGR